MLVVTKQGVQDYDDEITDLTKHFRWDYGKTFSDGRFRIYTAMPWGSEAVLRVCDLCKQIYDLFCIEFNKNLTYELNDCGKRIYVKGSDCFKLLLNELTEAINESTSFEMWKNGLLHDKAVKEFVTLAETFITFYKSVVNDKMNLTIGLELFVTVEDNVNIQAYKTKFNLSDAEFEADKPRLMKMLHVESESELNNAITFFL